MKRVNKFLLLSLSIQIREIQMIIFGTIQTSDQLKLKLFTNDVSEPKAVIMLTHGMGEHGLRYTQMAEFYASNGIGVIAFDIRGHGISEGKRGHTPSYEHLMDDLDKVYLKIKETYPLVPLFLFGHSMGGNLILNFLIRRKRQVAGAIVTGPYLRLGFEPPKWKIILAKISSNVFPKLTQPTGLELEALSRDKSVIFKYEEDSLVHDKITSSFFVNVHVAGVFAIENAGSIECPLLIMHGASDRLTSPDGSREFFENSNENVSLKIWDGLYHELHNEPENEEIFEFETNWIQKILG